MDNMVNPDNYELILFEASSDVNSHHDNYSYIHCNVCDDFKDYALEQLGEEYDEIIFTEEGNVDETQSRDVVVVDEGRNVLNLTFTKTNN